MRHYYIYYRVQHEHADLFLAQAQQMQNLLKQDLHLQPQLRFNLRRRIDTGPSESQTWMEVYEGLTSDIVSDFLVLLDQHVLQTGLMQWIAGPRHMECFTD